MVASRREVMPEQRAVDDLRAALARDMIAM